MPDDHDRSIRPGPPPLPRESDAEALDRILAWRRDVRHFRPDPLDQALRDDLRRSMDRAPSVGNARPWRIVEVRSAALRAAVRAEFQRCNAEAAAAYAADRRADYLRLKLAGLDVAALQLAVFTETEPEAGHRLGPRTMPETLHQSTAMAIQTLWLAARARQVGLGMVSILDPRRMEELFDLPATWAFSAYLCLGFPAFEDDLPLLDRAGWQASSPTEWLPR